MFEFYVKQPKEKKENEQLQSNELIMYASAIGVLLLNNCSIDVSSHSIWLSTRLRDLNKFGLKFSQSMRTNQMPKSDI